MAWKLRVVLIYNNNYYDDDGDDVWAKAWVHVKVRGQPNEVGSLFLPLMGSREQPQVSWQVRQMHLPTEQYCWSI